MTEAVAPKAAAPATSGTATRGSGKSADAAADGNAFMLALGACSAEADAGPVEQALADDAAPASMAAAGTDALPPATPVDATVPAAPVLAEPTAPAVDAATLLAQGAFAAASMPPPAALPQKVEGTASAGTAGTTAITATSAAALPSAATTPQPPAAATTQSLPPVAAGSPAPVAKSGGDAAAKTAAATPSATAAPSPDPQGESAVPWRGLPHAGVNATAASQNPAALMTQGQSPSQAPSTAAAQTAALPDTRNAAASLATTTPEPALQAAFASLGTVSRRGERSDERGGSMFSSASGVDARPAFAPGGSALMPAVDAASAGAAGGQTGLAERMVEQVSWWLSQRTQGAELTLDVPGGSPVSVSIQVQGNEAQVAFRSDQPEARQMLANAMPQLKDMLGAEGLLLSGSSVGTSDSGGRQGDAPPAAPLRAGQTAMDAGPGPATPQRSSASGRTLDLYV